MTEREIDWEALRDAATEAATEAYAPYSGLQVGAAGLAETGQVVVGCNVENASYGLTLCAECGVVTNLHLAGAETLVALSCLDVDGAFLTPCGRCRQLLYEVGGGDLLVDGPDGPRPLRELLPDAFGPEDLPR